MTGAANPASQKVFICYRREETAAHAGRLYDAMVARFGERNVFMDVDIEPGVDFVERITEVVSGCLVLIVVMGRNWATATDAEGRPRIDDPDDFVRLEVETALKRPDVTPIPVLVSGAKMPDREQLPPQLQPISRRNALELSDARWGYDVGRLNTTLDDLLGETGAVRETVEAPGTAEATLPAAGISTARLLIEGMLIAGASAFVMRYLDLGFGFSKEPNGHVAHVTMTRAVVWAVVGAALAAWLTFRSGKTNFVGAGAAGLLVGALAGALGGAAWAIPFFKSSGSPLSASAANEIQVGSVAITGAFLGALIGAQWRPPGIATGLASGLVGGVVAQLFLNTVGLENHGHLEAGISFGVTATVIAGVALAALVTRDQQSIAKAPAYASAEP